MRVRGLNSVVGLLVAGWAISLGWNAFPAAMAMAQPDPNLYFINLRSRPELFKAYSLRTQQEIDAYSQKKPNTDVIYDPTLDGAKASIQPFMAHRTLGADVDATSEILTFSSSVNPDLLVNGRQLKVEDEIVTIQIPNGQKSVVAGPNKVHVLRGKWGTRAVAHAAGAAVLLSNNNLQNQVRLPLGTEDGHNYFFVWDVRYDASYLDYSKGAKSYQFADSQRDTLWLEVRMNSPSDGIGSFPTFDRSRHIGVANARSYNTGLPSNPLANVTKIDPVTPQSGRFLVFPNRWTRVFVYLEQRPNDLDRVSMWMADEHTPAVQLLKDVTLQVRGTPSTVSEFWVELNTSQDGYKGSLDPLVSHFRNFVALQDVRDPTTLLQSPVGDSVGGRRPSAPRNLRIVGQ